MARYFDIRPGFQKSDSGNKDIDRCSLEIELLKATLAKAFANVETAFANVDSRLVTVNTALATLNTAANTIPRITTNVVTTSQNTSSTSYVDLTTAGPSITVTTNTSVQVVISARAYRSGGIGTTAWCAVDISGATTAASADGNGTSRAEYVAGYDVPLLRVFNLTGLTAGSNTFKLQYRCDGGGPWAFFERSITVIA